MEYENLLPSLIDGKNKELWDFCSSNAVIDLELSEKNEYGTFSQSGKHIIYVDQLDLDPATFAHELLHVYLDIKGVYVGGALSLWVDTSHLNNIFTPPLVDHVSNCLSHIKMLPLYVDMGYDIKRFITDYNVSKFSKREMNILGDNLKTSKGVYQAGGVDFYIGKYFAMKACPNKAFDYSKGYSLLKSLDSGLYNILEQTIAEWNDYDYNQNDVLAKSYRDVVYTLVDGLKEWSLGKNII